MLHCIWCMKHARFSRIEWGIVINNIFSMLKKRRMVVAYKLGDVIVIYDVLRRINMKDATKSTENADYIRNSKEKMLQRTPLLSNVILRHLSRILLKNKYEPMDCLGQSAVRMSWTSWAWKSANWIYCVRSKARFLCRWALTLGTYEGSYDRQIHTHYH